MTKPNQKSRTTIKTDSNNNALLSINAKNDLHLSGIQPYFLKIYVLKKQRPQNKKINVATAQRNSRLWLNRLKGNQEGKLLITAAITASRSVIFKSLPIIFLYSILFFLKCCDYFDFVKIFWGIYYLGRHNTMIHGVGVKTRIIS